MGDRCRTFSNRCIRDARHAGEHEYATSEDSLTLRAALDEAVARLRRLHGTITCVYHGNGVSIVNTSAAEGTSDSPQKVIYLETGAFLSRLDASDKGVR